MESGAVIYPHVEKKESPVLGFLKKRYKHVVGGGVSASVALWGYQTFTPKDQFRELKRDTAAIELRVNSQVTKQMDRIEASISQTNQRLDKTNERIDRILERLPRPATASIEKTIR
jgi:hypothetical protein